MAYIQVGGFADGAADAAPSPARCARGRRSQAHAPTGKQTENKKQGSQKVSQNFLGRGAETEQIGRVAMASRLQSEVYGDEKARRRRGIAAEPLGDCHAHLSPRTAFFPSVLYRYCFSRFRVRRAFATSLSAAALSPLCRSTVLCIRLLSSTRNRRRV